MLFRETVDEKNDVCFRPRLVLFDDRKGNFAGCNMHGQERSIPKVDETWDKSLEVHHAPTAPRSEFIQELEIFENLHLKKRSLRSSAGANDEDIMDKDVNALKMAAQKLNQENEVKHFADYLKVPLHPRSIQHLHNTWESDDVMNGWSCENIWNPELADEAEDRMRFFIEECDSFAGFQCFVDDLSSWGKISSKVLQNIKDDYGSSKTVAIFALRSSQTAHPHPSFEQWRQDLCQALSVSTFANIADLYVPLAAPTHTKYDHGGLNLLEWKEGYIFHESAILAAALEGATIPYRLNQSTNAGKSGFLELSDLADLLTSAYGVNLASISLSMPIDNNDKSLDSCALELIQSSKLSTATSLSGSGLGGSNDRGIYAESIVLRADMTQNIFSQSNSLLSSLCNISNEGLKCVQKWTIVPHSMPIPLPFPNIFGHKLGTSGIGHSSSLGLNSTYAVDCQFLTRMSGTTSFARALRDIQLNYKSAAASRSGMALLQSWDIDKQNSLEVMERLASIATAYDANDTLL